MEIKIPNEVKHVLYMLEAANFEAFIVGGCVRDSLLNIIPYDYDITTNALPSQSIKCLSDFRIIETGLKHGTITVISGKYSIEVTTYRIDGKYIDNRHPQSVTFTRNLSDDLQRRDFTINALAYSEKTGVIDLYNGVADLKNQIIRCVGNAFDRFKEDSLRILRALRFSSQLGFQIEKNTSDAIIALKQAVNSVSKERISNETTKLIMGNFCKPVLIKYSCVISEIIPEIKPCIGFNQHSKYHKFDVWEHIVTAVSVAKFDKIIRLTMLLHDIEKPHCFTLDSDGQGHFHNHEKFSSATAENILKRLKFDNKTIERVRLLISRHYFKPQAEKTPIKKLLSIIGEDAFFQLLDVQRADALAKNQFCFSRLTVLDESEKIAKEIINDSVCFSLKNLAVNGNDMLSLGLTGKSVGNALKYLLDDVINNNLSNQKEILIDQIKRNHNML